MSSQTPTPSLSYTYTTYSTSLPSSSFTKPTLVPSLFSFGPAYSCTPSASSQATPLPSNFPLVDAPQGPAAVCAISNAIETNDHAFWDVYECCKGGDVGAVGKPMPCTAQCQVKSEKEWKEVSECLRKRVDVVVCRVPANEGGGSSSASASASSGSATGSAATRSAAATSTGAASVVGSGFSGGSVMGVLVFGVLAVGSAVGMLM